jgi:hypothetical protein
VVKVLGDVRIDSIWSISDIGWLDTGSGGRVPLMAGDWDMLAVKKDVYWCWEVRISLLSVDGAGSGLLSVLLM